MALPLLGSPAPDFTLPSTAGTSVTLSRLRGRPLLLAFFPAAFTSVCTSEMCAFRDDWAGYEALGTLVLPISVDGVPCLREFKARERLTLDLLSDFRREASRAYGTLLEDRYLSTRAYFIVDREGLLRGAHREDTPGQRRETAELLANLRAVA